MKGLGHTAWLMSFDLLLLKTTGLLREWNHSNFKWNHKPGWEKKLVELKTTFPALTISVSPGCWGMHPHQHLEIPHILVEQSRAAKLSESISGTTWERLMAWGACLVLLYRVHFLFKGGREVLKFVWYLFWFWYLFSLSRVHCWFCLSNFWRGGGGKKHAAQPGAQRLHRIQAVPAGDVW